MLSEFVKRHIFSNRGLYSARAWEGKPLSFKLKFAIANNPEMTFATFMIVVVAPLLCTFKALTLEGSRREAIKKYKMFYKVVRDDDEDLDKIIAQKEMGRDYFPK